MAQTGSVVKGAFGTLDPAYVAAQRAKGIQFGNLQADGSGGNQSPNQASSWTRQYDDADVGNGWHWGSNSGQTGQTGQFGFDPAVFDLLDQAFQKLGIQNPDYLSLANGVIQRDNINGGSGFQIGSSAADIANDIIREASFSPQYQNVFGQMPPAALQAIRDTGYANGHGFYDPSGQIYQTQAQAGAGREQDFRSAQERANEANNSFGGGGLGGALQMFAAMAGGANLFSSLGAGTGLAAADAAQFGTAAAPAGTGAAWGSGIADAASAGAGAGAGGVTVSPYIDAGSPTMTAASGTAGTSFAPAAAGLPPVPSFGTPIGGAGSAAPPAGTAAGAPPAIPPGAGTVATTAAGATGAGTPGGDPDLTGIGNSAGTGYESLPGANPYSNGLDPSILNQLGQALGIPNLAQWLPLLKGGLGVAGGLNTLFGGQSNQGDPTTLFNAGNQVWQTAQDPRNELYARTLQQTQDASRAATSARGIGMSPVAAGIENDATRNFNIDWQNAQLGRQVAGAGALGNAYAQGTGRQGAQAGQSAAGTNAVLTGMEQLFGGGANPGQSPDLSWLGNIFGGGTPGQSGGSGSYDPTAYLTYLNQQASQPAPY